MIAPDLRHQKAKLWSICGPRAEARLGRQPAALYDSGRAHIG